MGCPAGGGEGLHASHRRRRCQGGGFRAAATTAAAAAGSATPAPKTVWIETTNSEVLIAAIEVGLSTTALFPAPHAKLAQVGRRRMTSG